MSEVLGDLEMSRGDSYPLPLTITRKSTGLPLDLTGYGFILTVTTDKDPIDDTTVVFQCVGVIDAVPSSGKLSFTPTPTDTDNVGKFWYDIQFISGNTIRTITKKKRFIIIQDNTKVTI